MIDRQEIDKRYIYISHKKIVRLKSRWILSPISNTHSYLLIERSSSNTGLCLFFQEFLISKAAYHKHPPPYDQLGGCSPFESNKVSSRGFIATFILKETEEPTCGAHLFWYFSRASSLIVTSSVWQGDERLLQSRKQPETREGRLLKRSPVTKASRHNQKEGVTLTESNP